MTWYAIATFRRELDLVSELRSFGLGGYVPCETVNRNRGRQRRVITRPVVPGYVFTFCEPDDFAKIRALDGVYDFVATTLADGSRAPAQMPPKALQWMFLAEMFGDLDQTRQPQAYSPHRGDRVKVRSGKWKGYIGRIISVGKRKASMQLESGIGRMEVLNDHLEAA